jgi:hypothetical protein
MLLPTLEKLRKDIPQIKKAHLLIEIHSRWQVGWENAKSVHSSQGKGWLFEESQIYIFGYYMIPYVLFRGFDVFTIILQCRNSTNK